MPWLSIGAWCCGQEPNRHLAAQPSPGAPLRRVLSSRTRWWRPLDGALARRQIGPETVLDSRLSPTGLATVIPEPYEEHVLYVRCEGMIKGIEDDPTHALAGLLVHAQR